MAATARVLLLSRFTDLTLKLPKPPPLISCHHHHHFLRPVLTATTTKIHSATPTAINCLISGVDGGGVADDFFISTQKSGFDREFSVIAAMLKRIEPLDNSVISKGVSAAARGSMKRTISTMLGLLPSDQFSVTIRVSRGPLHHLLVSSIITGYTLWNAEYRVSLMRNFDICHENIGESLSSRGCEVLEEECVEREDEEGEVDSDGCDEGEGGSKIPESIGDLSPEVLSYIQELKLELATIEKKLDAQKQENMRMECDREENNDLLEYLRSLEPDMVTELSRPSSSEVEEIIHQLVQNILQKFFKDDTASVFSKDSFVEKAENHPVDDVEIKTSRDYLAKLLFWCMLLGHHLRGLENRLHLSCAVGLL